MPFFSIVIPTYNRASLIKNTIMAFLSQTFTDFELIIIDDGSTDNTQEIVNEIKDERVVYKFVTNRERGAARNYGARMAKGIYLNFFDSDDSPYDNHLSNAFEFIQNNNSPTIFHVGYRTVNKDGSIQSEETNFNYNIYDRLIKTNFFGCNSVFIQKDIFLKDPFNESRDLASSEDWELWLRLSSKHSILSCNKITFQMNNHETRSLFTIPPEKVVIRDSLLTELLINEDSFKKKYKKYLPMFISERFTFYSLIYSLTKKDRLLTIKYLFKAFKSDLFVITRPRFWASIKHLI